MNKIHLKTPLSKNDVKNLKVGDIVEISGTIFTARDAAHQWICSGKKIPINLKDQIIYHCGPIIVKHNGKWLVKAAGPTTSAREELYEYDIIKNLGVRAIIGKGGMGENTLKACQKFCCVYLCTIGGAAQVLAEKITEIKNVYLMKELGSLEAIWEFDVEGFPTIVTMDSNGNSLHKDIFNKSTEKFNDLLSQIKC